MLTLRSYAKLNLFLQVLRKRSDGFHSLKTLFERISLHDTVTFKPRHDGRIVLTCTNPELPVDERNIAMRAALLLRKRCRRQLDPGAGADIHILKRIPLGSGMAGGSSNASTVLIGLSRLWKLNISRKQLIGLAARLGSDCPFFIQDCSFALASGRGEKIKAVPALKRIRLRHIIIVPGINVSTAEIFRKWDKQSTINLTKPPFNVKILCLALKNPDLTDISRYLYNNLEPVTSRSYPQIKRIRRFLATRGLKSILMSGSGPAVYALVPSPKEAMAICKERSIDRSWKVFCASTV